MTTTERENARPSEVGCLLKDILIRAPNPLSAHHLHKSYLSLTSPARASPSRQPPQRRPLPHPHVLHQSACFEPRHYASDLVCHREPQAPIVRIPASFCDDVPGELPRAQRIIRAL
jgi:hypothetical protein